MNIGAAFKRRPAHARDSVARVVAPAREGSRMPDTARARPDLLAYRRPRSQCCLQNGKILVLLNQILVACLVLLKGIFLVFAHHGRRKADLFGTKI